MLWLLASFFVFWTSPYGKRLRSYVREQFSIGGWRHVLPFVTVALLLIDALSGSNEFSWITFDKIAIESKVFAVMPSWPVLVVYAMVYFVLPLLASTNSQLFLGASIA